MAGYQMAMSRNRATEGRASKNPLDIYMQKGQIVARQMPMSRVDFPSDAQVRNTASVVREREIEKQLDLGDVMALRWRANKSRYNWWEILGKIYISQEYNNPGSTRACNKILFRQSGRSWCIYCGQEILRYMKILDFGTPEEYAKNHYWRYATHREAGMVEQHRGIEVLRYKEIPIAGSGWSGGRPGNFYEVRNTVAKPGHIVMFVGYRRRWYDKWGESGLVYWTATDPWWLDAPFPFMP